MKYIHSEKVIESFPNNFTGIVGNVVIKDKQRLQEIAQGFFSRLDENTPLVEEAISGWQSTFSKMGAKPKYKSSLEEVKRFYDEKKKIYSISPIVDFYNAYSLCNGIPMGAYDATKIVGDISLRFAAKDEPFTPLGNPNQIEKTKNGEIVYADAEKVTCRYWNLQDCHQTRITDETQNVIFFFDIIGNQERSAETQWDKTKQDFMAIFGPDIFAGLTGKNHSNTLNL